jgi:predicted DCC family thiol-disulfide oxidoreductase YuxK
LKNADETKVFFDGACPLCSREIKFYKGKAKGANVSWVDISLIDPGDVVPGLTKEDALKRFHLLDSKGVLLSGAKAFAALWLVLPSFKWLGLVAQQQPFTFILEVFYRTFLLMRPHLQTSLRSCKMLKSPRPCDDKEKPSPGETLLQKDQGVDARN